MSLDDILIRRRDAADNAIALFQDGKLKPGVLVYACGYTKKLRDEYNNHITKFDQFQQSIIDTIETSINNFFGIPRQQFDIQVSHVKTAIDNLAKLRSEYDAHIAQLGTLRKNFNRTDDAIDKFFGKKISKSKMLKQL